VGVGKRATLTLKEDGGRSAAQDVDAADHRQALALLLLELDRRRALSRVAAVGHRIVHGGSRLVQACAITPSVPADLRALEPIDPDHLPSELAIVDALTAQLPKVPQVACFDTAFHASLPRAPFAPPAPARGRGDSSLWIPRFVVRVFDRGARAYRW